MNEDIKKEISLEIDSRLENVYLIGKEVKKICQSFNLNKMEIYEIELCIVEACTNVIRHAYKEKPGNVVKITISLENRCKLILKVYDWGESMDPEYLDKAESDIYKFSEGGRGLLIIKKLMDEVSYKTKKNGNVLTMIKKISPVS